MNVHFISGHLDLTEAEFREHYAPKIDAALAAGDAFVVGDAKGADLFAQQYLKGKTGNVAVYHMLAMPRNNVGFATVGGFATDDERDVQMTAVSTTDIAWVRPGREEVGHGKEPTTAREMNMPLPPTRLWKDLGDFTKGCHD